LIFSSHGFEAFQIRKFDTGGDAIIKQLSNLDLQIVMDYAYVEWRELVEKKSTRDKWED
jgi:hypothetical protein